MPDFTLDNQDLSANIDSEVFSEDELPKKSIGEIIKPYTGIAIKIIILLVILAFAYWFFFMRYANVTFKVVNYSKGDSPILTTINLEQNGSVEKYNTSDESTTNSVRILPGTYTISIDDSDVGDFYLPNDTLEITKDDDGSSITIFLYPEWAKDIGGFKIEKLPNSIYSNQEVTFKLGLNNSGKMQNIVIKGTGDLNSVNQPIDIKPGKNILLVKFDNFKKPDENLKGSLYIQYAQDLFYTTNINMKVKKLPQVNLVPQKTSYDVNSGSEVTIVFDVDNKSQETISDLNLKLSTANMDIDIINPWIKSISQDINVNPNEKIQIEVVFNVPIREEPKDGEKINLKFTLENSFVNVSKDVELRVHQANIELPKSLDFSTVVAGTLLQKNITISNNTQSKIKITKDILIKITKTNSTNSNYPTDADIYKSIIINPITELNPGANELNITLNILPIYSSENLEGTITLFTEAGELYIPFKFNIQSMDVKLEIQMQTQFKVYPDPNTQNLKTKELTDSTSVTISNTGNIDLNINSITVGGDCKDWPDVSPALTQLTLLPSKKSFSFFLKFTAISTSTLNSSKICILDVSYYDPKTSDGSNLMLGHKQLPFNISLSS